MDGAGEKSEVEGVSTVEDGDRTADVKSCLVRNDLKSCSVSSRRFVIDEYSKFAVCEWNSNPDA